MTSEMRASAYASHLATQVFAIGVWNPGRFTVAQAEAIVALRADHDRRTKDIRRDGPAGVERGEP